MSARAPQRALVTAHHLVQLALHARSSRGRQVVVCLAPSPTFFSRAPALAACRWSRCIRATNDHRHRNCHNSYAPSCLARPCCACAAACCACAPCPGVLTSHARLGQWHDSLAGLATPAVVADAPRHAGAAAPWSASASCGRGC
ncbi:hypothetical protein PF006_g31471 [Phytophthora fragariae]|uniref:Uncharacterized protein n=3 Tax=Phytophthora fragariae TaxID=53985 RepID=A0A6A3PTK1_9STRA|nr:hypothetical protein PF009_g31578 [Phytophthora fragariae]KAE8966153.1 hypothetical protein PF011_g28042 [Phytophthora fragariae]KAE9061188.1 hypothetical protein PF006_g31471 [Phytophthora fragariae]